MKTSMKIFISSIVLSLIMLTLGTYLIVGSIDSESGEVVVVGEAPGDLVFQSSTLTYYDIYAEGPDTTIELGDFSYDSDFTYLEMCKDDAKATGITGDCGTYRAGNQFIGSLTIGASDGGNTILETSGSGQVEIVATPVAAVGSALLVFCTGCCFGPLVALVSGIKAFKNERGYQVIIQNPQEGKIYAQDMNFNNQFTNQEQPPYAQNQNIQNPTNAEVWDQSGSVNSQFPPATMNGMSDPSGTEWLDYEGRKYYRVIGINTNWNLYKQ
jgi:hypothetical protein